MLWRIFVAWVLVAIFSLCLAISQTLGVSRWPYERIIAILTALVIVAAIAAVLPSDD